MALGRVVLVLSAVLPVVLLAVRLSPSLGCSPATTGPSGNINPDVRCLSSASYMCTTCSLVWLRFSVLSSRHGCVFVVYATEAVRGSAWTTLTLDSRKWDQVS